MLLANYKYVTVLIITSFSISFGEIGLYLASRVKYVASLPTFILIIH